MWLQVATLIHNYDRWKEFPKGIIWCYHLMCWMNQGLLSGIAFCGTQVQITCIFKQLCAPYKVISSLMDWSKLWKSLTFIENRVGSPGPFINSIIIQVCCNYFRIWEVPNNQRKWPGDVHWLSDLVPDGLSFLKAHRAWSEMPGFSTARRTGIILEYWMIDHLAYTV